MDASQRREQILAILRSSSEPVSAASLAAAVHVSRQIIVGDIALLRAAGTEIHATPRGYLLQGKDEETAGRLLYTSPAATTTLSSPRSFTPSSTTGAGSLM